MATGPPDPVCSYELSSLGPGWRAILSRKVTSAMARPAQVAAVRHVGLSSVGRRVRAHNRLFGSRACAAAAKV